MNYNKRLLIIGAGGHGRVIAEIASRLDVYSEISFLDDNAKDGLPIIGKVAEYVKYIDSADFVIGIGSNSTRERIHAELSEHNAKIVSLIHPNSVIAKDVIIGEGTVIMAGAIVNTGAKIGKSVILNTSSSVDHDCVVDDFVHVSVGAHIAGSVKIGNKTFVGAGATVINNIDICRECMIGAGAVVVNNLTVKGVYVGVPARITDK